MVRVLITGASLGEALGLFALSALYAFHLFLESKKEPIANQDLWNRLIELEEAHKSVRDKISSIQVASSFKRQ